MNEYMRDWVDALRGGEYEQAVGALKRVNIVDGSVGWCCLGVACDLAGVQFQTDDGEEYYRVTDETEEKSLYELPRWLREILGLTQRDETHLMQMNDQHHNTFSEIASWLEEKFDG